MPSIRDDVASWVESGRSLDEIETRLLARSALSADQQAQLWLYAWGRHWRGTGRGGSIDRPRRVPDVPGC
jgi:hypothetical protein